MASIGTAPVPAVGTLTSDATAPTAADTVTVGGVTYTFRASVGTTANEVLIGASAATAMQNLFDAINATAAKSGVTYGSLTVKNPQVKATAVTATTVVVRAKAAGTIGNLIPSTEASTHLAWGASTLASGTGSIGDALQAILTEFQLPADLYQVIVDLGADKLTA
jgi:hypothetical protein